MTWQTIMKGAFDSGIIPTWSEPKLSLLIIADPDGHVTCVPATSEMLEDTGSYAFAKAMETRAATRGEAP